jgi:hypothetical protein
MADDKPQDSSRPPEGEQGSSSGTGESKSRRKSRTPPTIDVEASRIDATDAAQASAESESSAESTPRVDEPASDRSRDTSRAGVVVAAATGAAAAVLIGCAAWFAGLVGNASPLDVPTIATIETLQARLARLEESTAPKSEPKSDVSTRLDTIEKSTTQSLAAMRDELSAVHAKGDRTAGAIDDMKSSSSAAVTPDVSAMQDRIAQLESKMQAMTAENTQLKNAQAQARSQAAEVKAASADDVRLKQAIAAASLDLSVRQGEPFAPVLAAAKQFSGETAALQSLDGFAANGVPNAMTLSRELLALLPQLGAKPEPVSTYSGWFDRLRASATRLIRIRRADTAAGNDTPAVVARAAVAARRNDLVAARSELNVLPPADRAKVQSWIDKVDARDAALGASRQFAANAMTALAKPAP